MIAGAASSFGTMFATMIPQALKQMGRRQGKPGKGIVVAGGQQAELGQPGRDHAVGQIRRPGQEVIVAVLVAGAAGERQAHRPLGVGINKQSLPATAGKRVGKVDAKGCLAHSSFLACRCYGDHDRDGSGASLLCICKISGLCTCYDMCADGYLCLSSLWDSVYMPSWPILPKPHCASASLELEALSNSGTCRR